MSRSALLLVPLLLTTLACESVMPNRGAGAERVDELAELKARVLELEREGRMNEVELARLRRQVAELSERVEGGQVAPTAEPTAPVAQPPVPPPVVEPAAPVPREKLEAEDLPMPERPPAPPSESAPKKVVLVPSGAAISGFALVTGPPGIALPDSSK